MTLRSLLPLMAAILLLSDFVPVEAQPKPTSKSQPSPQPLPTMTPPVQPAWKVFTAPDGRFSVLMPGMPKMLTQTQKTYMGEVNLQVFIAQPPQQEVAYIVTYNDFPYNYAQMANPQTILKNAQDMALKTTRSNLVSQRDIRSSNGHLGREIVYINSIGKITKNRLYFAEGRLYQVMAITSRYQQRFLSQTITGYLNSFNIVLRA